MTAGKEERAEEIIIVRRRNDEGDHHHGGVWKIAFADFMTAMMAFFLVMWLINASNTETKASVASYFNPVKLTDSVVRKKGLLDIDEKNNAEVEQRKSDPAKSAQKAAEAIQNAVAEASKKPVKQGAPERVRGSGPDTNAAPAIRREQIEANAGAAQHNGPAFRDPFAPFDVARAVQPEAKTGAPGTPTVDARTSHQQQADTESSAGRTNSARATAVPPVRAERLAEVAELQSRVRREVERLGLTGGPAIDLTIEGDDIVLNLTDTAKFGMFAVGSAEPNDLLSKLIAALTPIMSGYADRMILRGHTDARPFRGDNKNNNWRLAMARAEAAYAMLLQSGIEEGRFERIEAHADRKLRLPSDPQAAVNRRIEIIMRRSSR